MAAGRPMFIDTLVTPLAEEKSKSLFQKPEIDVKQFALFLEPFLNKGSKNKSFLFLLFF